MNKTALAFGIGAGLLLAAGTASAAGNCTMEIDALQQNLGMDESANARTGPTDTGVQQPSPSASTDMSSSGGSTSTSMSNGSSVATNNGSTGANATIGATDPGAQQPSPAANATTGTGMTTDTGSVATNSGAGAATGTTTDDGGSDTMASNSGGSGSSGTMSSGSSGTSTLSPTITETSRSGEMNTITPSARSSALAALEKAKLYAKSGEENACMTEVGNAKQQLGIK